MAGQGSDPFPADLFPNHTDHFQALWQQHVVAHPNILFRKARAACLLEFCCVDLDITFAQLVNFRRNAHAAGCAYMHQVAALGDTRAELIAAGVQPVPARAIICQRNYAASLQLQSAAAGAGGGVDGNAPRCRKKLDIASRMRAMRLTPMQEFNVPSQELVDLCRGKIEAGVMMPKVDYKSRISYTRTHLWEKDAKLGANAQQLEAESIMLTEENKIEAAGKLAAKAQKAFTPPSQVAVLKTRHIVAWIAAAGDRAVDANAALVVLNATTGFTETVNRLGANCAIAFDDYYQGLMESRSRGITALEAANMTRFPDAKDVDEFERTRRRQIAEKEADAAASAAAEKRRKDDGNRAPHKPDGGKHGQNGSKGGKGNGGNRSKGGYRNDYDRRRDSRRRGRGDSRRRGGDRREDNSQQQRRSTGGTGKGAPRPKNDNPVEDGSH